MAKLPIGNLTLHPRGDVMSVHVRMNLWDGEVSASLTTTNGTISVQLLTFGGMSAPSGGGSGIVIAASNTTGSERATWVFTAANASANAPHPVYKTESYACKDAKYKANPTAIVGTNKGLSTTVQPLLAGPLYATALSSIVHGVAGVTVLATTAPVNGTDVAKNRAISDALYAMGAWQNGTLINEHRNEWHTFYTNASFVSLQHARLEQFYWITQYKLGSGMGLRGDLEGDGGVMDHTSPWYLPNNGVFDTVCGTCWVI